MIDETVDLDRPEGIVSLFDRLKGRTIESSVLYEGQLVVTASGPKTNMIVTINLWRQEDEVPGE